MGQAITVVEKGGTRPDVVVFELNRSLTGMGHERYRSLEDAAGNRPPDHVARILFEHGGVQAVHIYSNVVTVDLAPAASTEGMAEALRNLFIHYREGVTPSLP
jgi:hypothetical protein